MGQQQRLSPKESLYSIESRRQRLPFPSPEVHGRGPWDESLPVVSVSPPPPPSGYLLFSYLFIYFIL